MIDGEVIVAEKTRAPVILSDGTSIQIGELVGTLHFWNEHLPRYSEHGPDLGWACAVRDRIRYSLRAFSRLARSDERNRGSADSGHSPMLA